MVLNYDDFEYKTSREDLEQAMTEILIDDRIGCAMKKGLYITKENIGIVKFYIKEIIEGMSDEEFDDWCEQYESELEDFFRDDAMEQMNTPTCEELEDYGLSNVHDYRL